ncbi:hypothetical protein ET282_04205, partial [Salmonella enterica]|nr:hypothetical protein [Salmonella enterica]
PDNRDDGSIKIRPIHSILLPSLLSMLFTVLVPFDGLLTLQRLAGRRENRYATLPDIVVTRTMIANALIRC